MQLGHLNVKLFYSYMTKCMICGCEICQLNFVFFYRKCCRKHDIKKGWITKNDLIKYIESSFRLKVDKILRTREIYSLLKNRYPNIYPLNQIFEKLLFMKFFNPIYF